MTIVVNAYPGFKLISEEDKKRFKRSCIELQKEEPGAFMTVLYPFGPDFYKKMGFGYGTNRISTT